MTGIEIQYLLGIFFIVESLALPMNNNTWIKLVCGIIILILAVIHKTFI